MLISGFSYVIMYIVFKISTSGSEIYTFLMIFNLQKYFFFCDFVTESIILAREIR